MKNKTRSTIAGTLIGIGLMMGSIPIIIARLLMKKILFLKL